MTMPSGSADCNVCDQFLTAWKAGRRPILEDFVRAAPEPDRAALFRRLLAIEKEQRSKSDRPLAEAEARGRFADLGLWAGDAMDEAFPAVVLEATAGPHAGHAFPLPGHARFTIGR